jgi:hypothetical protein
MSLYQRFHDRFGTAGVVIGVIAMIAALGGTALAASKLNSTQKKEVKRIAKAEAQKYANSNPGAPGSNGTNGKDGAQGIQGIQGQDGSDGKSVEVGTENAGTTNCEERGGVTVKVEGSSIAKYACNGKEGSPWTAGGTLPEGAMESGTWWMKATGTNENVAPLSFPIPLSPADAAAISVHVTDADGDETCEGSVNAPTAFEGELCVYVGPSSGSTQPGLGTESVYKPDYSTPGVGTSGGFIFAESFNPSTGSYVGGSFAVTAP